MSFQLFMIGAELEPCPVLVNGEPVIFETGREASNACRNYAALAPYTKIQPRPVKSEAIDDSAWHAREAAKFASGEYERTIWHNETWFHDNPATRFHFLHLSRKQKGKVSFTLNTERGRADIQEQAMNPGRYLEQYYSNVLDDWERRAWTQKFIEAHSDSELHIARDTETIVYVYQNGPSSCMSHSESNYNSSVHPVSVYGESDLGVAFILSDGSEYTEDVEDATYTVAARCLVWPDEMLHGRIYGDGSARSRMLQNLLASAGYTSGQFWGAKLRKIEEDGDYVMPYLDYADRVMDCGSHFEISRNGNILACSTCGIVERGPSCEHCGEDIDHNDGIYIRNAEETWCSSCADDNAFRCDYSGDYFSDDETAVEMADGNVWSELYFHRYGFNCAHCEQNHPNRERVGLDADDNPVCIDCAESHLHLWQSDARYHEEQEPDDVLKAWQDAEATRLTELAAEQARLALAREAARAERQAAQQESDRRQALAIREQEQARLIAEQARLTEQARLWDSATPEARSLATRIAEALRSMPGHIRGNCSCEGCQDRIALEASHHGLDSGQFQRAAELLNAGFRLAPASPQDVLEAMPELQATPVSSQEIADLFAELVS